MYIYWKWIFFFSQKFFFFLCGKRYKMMPVTLTKNDDEGGVIKQGTR